MDPYRSKKKRARARARSSGEDLPPETIRAKKPRHEHGGGARADRISDLPDEILSLILQRVEDTRTAVRTSVLSRRWVHIWRSLTRFHFSIDAATEKRLSAMLWRPRLTASSPPTAHDIGFDRVMTLERSARAFLINAPKVDQLSIDFCTVWGHFARIDDLVGLALDKGVPDLRLGRTDGWRFLFPSSQFRKGNSLTRLELDTCMLHLPRNLDGFNSLSNLSLSNVWIQDDGLTNLLDNCKQLESLCLNRCYFCRVTFSHMRLKRLIIRCCEGMDTIDLRMPKLEKLHYVGRLPASPPLASLPCLRCLWLEITCSDEDWVVAADYMLGQLSAYIPHVKDLALWYRTATHPIALKAPPVSYKSLRNLTLKASAVHTEGLIWMTLLLEAAPFLESLETDIHMVLHKRGSCYEIQNPCNFQHYHLKKLTMNQFIGKRNEIAFARFVLEKALVLEFMVISHRTIVHNTDWTRDLVKSRKPWSKVSRARFVQQLTKGITTGAQIVFS